MAQLKMYWLKGTPVEHFTLPEGFGISTYKDASDRAEWLACCRNGLISDEAGDEAFTNAIDKHDDICQATDVMFLDFEGKHIATATGLFHPKGNWGELHMVGMKTEWRGKGLAKYLVAAAVAKMAAQGVDFIELTTDEWRKGAIKGYLNAGFVPVEYDVGMEDRWKAILPEYGIRSIPMVYEDASFYKTLVIE